MSLDTKAPSAADTLFLEPFAGMAGDMLLAALLDLKDPRFTLDDLRELANALVPGEAVIEAETAWRQSLSGLCLTVRTPESARSPHRGYRDLERRISAAPLAAATKERACSVLWRIAVAEGKVHGCAPEEIHFHEIGAVDSLIDVCGAALALERLGVARVIATPPLVGSGTVRCAHGDMPVPVPAVAELLRGVPHVIGGGGERLTPTGAALLLEYAESFDPPGAFIADRIGYGAGHRDPTTGPPNILRLQLGRPARVAAPAVAWQLD
jgi:pyridinium-3,5-bisthiocarboxylic acid mononucleotide nickel chelatase